MQEPEVSKSTFSIRMWFDDPSSQLNGIDHTVSRHKDVDYVRTGICAILPIPEKTDEELEETYALLRKEVLYPFTNDITKCQEEIDAIRCCKRYYWELMGRAMDDISFLYIVPFSPRCITISKEPISAPLSLSTNDRTMRTLKFDPNWLGAELQVSGCCVESGDAYKFVRNNECWKHIDPHVPDVDDPDYKDYWERKLILTQISPTMVFGDDNDEENGVEPPHIPFVLENIDSDSAESIRERMKRMIHIKTKVFNQVRNAVAPDQWFMVIGLIGDAFIDGPDDCRLYPMLKNYIVNSLDFSDCDEDVEERFYQHVFNALSLTGSKINHSVDDRYVFSLTFSPILAAAIKDDFQNICDLYQIDPDQRFV